MKRRAFVALAGGLLLGGNEAGAARLGERSRSRSASRQKQEPQGVWQELWNGRDLSGWQGCLDPEAKGPSEAQIFSVVQDGGRSLLRISGEVFGALVSEGSFRNYQLRIEWKWGEAKHPPRVHLRRSSGVVVHSLLEGPRFGANKPWRPGLELDLQEGSCGDLWIGEGVGVEVPARRERFMGKPLYVFAPAQRPEPLPQDEVEPHVVKSSDYERGYGDWNTAEAYMFESDGAFVINGAMTVQFRNATSRTASGVVPLAEGPVQLVSEGAELFVRRVAIRPLDKLPDRLRVRGPRG